MPLLGPGEAAQKRTGAHHPHAAAPVARLLLSTECVAPLPQALDAIPEEH
jgi:hypothetical protein